MWNYTLATMPSNTTVLRARFSPNRSSRQKHNDYGILLCTMAWDEKITVFLLPYIKPKQSSPNIATETTTNITFIQRDEKPLYIQRGAIENTSVDRIKFLLITNSIALHLRVYINAEKYTSELDHNFLPTINYFMEYGSNEAGGDSTFKHQNTIYQQLSARKILCNFTLIYLSLYVTLCNEEKK